MAVDLPNGQTLFALRYDRSAGATPALAFGTARLTKSTSNGSAEIIRPERRNPVWGQDGYPRFVWFRDITDPSSVERVDPPDFAEVFGEGYALRRITAQLTYEPPTFEIIERLAWLNDHIERRVRLNDQSGPIMTNQISDQLSATSFSFRGNTK